MLRNLTEKLRGKLPATTRVYTRVKFAHLNYAFSEYFELEASSVEVQQKDKKKRKMKGRKKEKKI